MQELGFDEKMELSADRKRRGNALVGAKQHEWADAEYDAAGQYLAMILHADLTPEQIHAKEEALVAVNLNAAMTRLRRGKANESMDLCHAVLELRPEESKALFRLGQAHAEVANHDEAKAFLTRAEAAATQAGDEERLKAIRLELGRLARSVRESRQREKAFFKKAVNSTPPPPTPTLVQKLLRRHPLGARISLPCSLLIVSLYGMQLWNGEPPGFAEIAVVSGSVMYLTNWILPVASLVDSGVIR